MPDVATLLKEFVDELNAGKQPDAMRFIDQADSEGDRKELAGLIDLSLTMAPETAIHPRDESGNFTSPVTRAQIEEIVDQALEAPRGWRVVLPELRIAIGLTVADVARETVVAGGFEASDENVGAAKRWIEEMESGLVSARSISSGALAAVARVLRAPLETLVWEGSEGGAVASYRVAADAPADLAERLDAVSELIDDGIAGEGRGAVDAWFAAS